MPNQTLLKPFLIFALLFALLIGLGLLFNLETPAGLFDKLKPLAVIAGLVIVFIGVFKYSDWRQRLKP